MEDYTRLKNLVMEESLAGQEAGYIARALPEAKRLLAVMDKHTAGALGTRVEQALAKEYRVQSHIYQGKVEATAERALEIEPLAKSVDVLVAVGSGTINDLCKYVSYWLEKPYVVFPTAPSMNGYLSANASISIDGHKKSLAAHMPITVLVDLSVLCAAPERLIRAGLGDSLCRPTAQADWYLSNQLLGTAYDPLPFAMLKDAEKTLLENPSAVLKGDMEAMEALMEMLLLSGVGMSLARGSYPASQGEHMIAHMMEMHGGVNGSLHGEDIAVTTRTMMGLQRRMMEEVPKLMYREPERSQLADFIGGEVADACLEAYAVKGLSRERVEILNASINKHWYNITHKIRGFYYDKAAVEELWQVLGLPQEPADIGWKASDYATACDLASLMRERFTFLDLAYHAVEG